MRNLRLLLVVWAAGVLLAGCGGGADTPTAAPPVATSTPKATAIPATPSEPPVAASPSAGPPDAVATWPADAVPAIAQAQKDVAQRTKVAPAAVAVVSVTEHDWPTPALGCPQEGHAYIQVITPGYIIVLAAGGQTYTYHADKKGNIATCADS